LTSDEFYRASLRDDLSQGDILEFCPVGSVPAVRVARLWRSDAGQQRRAFVYEHPLTERVKNPPAPGLFRADGGVEKGDSGVLFDCWMKRCVVVSDDCVALAKAQNQSLSMELTSKAKNAPWHVIPLEPWPSDGEVVPKTGERVGDLIAAGRVKKYLEFPYLSKDGKEVLARGFADMRYLTPVKPEVFQGVRRIASLSDRAVGVLWGKVFTYFSGKDLQAITCPSCGKAHSFSDFLRASSARPEGEGSG